MKLTANLRWQARAVTVSCYYCVSSHMITSHSKVLVPTGAHGAWINLFIMAVFSFKIWHHVHTVVYRLYDFMYCLFLSFSEATGYLFCFQMRSAVTWLKRFYMLLHQNFCKKFMILTSILTWFSCPAILLLILLYNIWWQALQIKLRLDLFSVIYCLLIFGNCCDNFI